MKKTIRIATSNPKAKELGIPCRSSHGVVAPFEVDLELLSPAARFVAEHITATYIKDEYTDKIPVMAIAGFTMAERDRAKGLPESDIASFTKAYGEFYAKDRMTMRISFPYYGKHMKRPEDVIEEAVRQCVSSGTTQFKSGTEVFDV